MKARLKAKGFKQIFCKVAEISGHLLECRILIDLLDAKCRFEARDIDRFFSGLDAKRLSHLSHTSKVALVSVRTNKEYDHLNQRKSGDTRA